MTLKPKHIYLSFLTLVLLFFAAIFYMYMGGKEEFYKNEVNNTIIEIIPVRGRPLQKRVMLNDSSVLYLPDKFVTYVEIGDSLIKKKNDNFIYLKSIRHNRFFKASI